MLFTTKFTAFYFLTLAAILGACMGSFLNCMAWRIVHGESVMNGRSHCDQCGHVLGIGDLIPIVSYLAHKGKCRWCGAKLSKLYLWSEIISAVVFASIVYKFDISLNTLQYLLWASILLACSFADLEGYIIPDGFIIAAVVIRAVFILLAEDKIGELTFTLLGGIAVAAALLLIVTVFEKVVGREAMGGGDIKLIFVTGMYLGWQKNLLCLFLSCILGIIFGLATQKKRETQKDAKIFPFGPSIAAAAWLCLLFGDKVIGWYTGLFR